MPQSSQLQPRPDRCLYSRTTSFQDLTPHPCHDSFTCILYILGEPCLWDYFNHGGALHPNPNPTTPQQVLPRSKEVNLKITRYLPVSSAIHPYLYCSRQPMDVTGDEVESILGQTLLSKRHCGRRGRPYIRARADIATHLVAHLQTHIYRPLYQTCVLQFYRCFEYSTNRKNSASRLGFLELRLKSQTSRCI